MAVHAQYASFPHDPRTIITRPALDNAMSASVFHGEPHPLLLPAAAVGGHAAFSDLTCINNDGYLAPRKRALLGDVEGHSALLPPSFAPAGDVHGRVLCSGTASTSGRPASQGLLLSHLYRHGVETDALIRIENERLRAGLQEARRRHVREAVSAVERLAARRLRAAEAELERVMARNAELDERLRQTVAEGHAWRDVARGHEAAAAGLRATLDNLVAGGGEVVRRGSGEGQDGAAAEDAESCCFVEQEEEAEVSGGRSRAACKACGAADVCVLLLPCRHLCLCRGCDVEVCPVCAAAKNASLHVLLP